MNKNKYPEGSIIMCNTPMELETNDSAPAYFPLVIEEHGEDAYICSNPVAKKLKIVISYDEIEKSNFKSLDEYKAIIRKQAKEIGTCKRINFINIALAILFVFFITMCDFSFINSLLYTLCGLCLFLLFIFNQSVTREAEKDRDDIEIFCFVQLLDKTLDEKECFKIFKMMKAKKDWKDFKADASRGKTDFINSIQEHQEDIEDTDSTQADKKDTK